MRRGYRSTVRSLSLIASGPSDEGWDWTRGFLEEIVRKGPGQLRSIYGLALHYYAWNLSRGRTKEWNEGKGDALKFDSGWTGTNCCARAM